MPAGVFRAAPSTASWLREGAESPVLRLPRWRPHLFGGALALVSVAIGVLAQRDGFAASQALGWLALAGVGAGMLLHTVWRQADGGWRVDFERRCVEPLDPSPEGVEAVQIAGAGWSIQVTPGERRGQLAIDLRHEDRGRVARLVDRPARGLAEVQRLSDLADLLARRLQVARSGPTLRSG
jgi:hypothetical protein